MNLDSHVFLASALWAAEAPSWPLSRTYVHNHCCARPYVHNQSLLCTFSPKPAQRVVLCLLVSIGQEIRMETPSFHSLSTIPLRQNEPSLQVIPGGLCTTTHTGLGTVQQPVCLQDHIYACIIYQAGGGPTPPIFS